jgi:osmotically-inducible protein OsmY
MNVDHPGNWGRRRIECLAFQSAPRPQANRATVERDTVKTDTDLKADVMAELEWDASINASHVGVAVADGMVTLTGHLDTFAEKYAVEQAVQRVQGVQAIAVELDVKLEHGHRRLDSEIAAAAQQALEWQALVPADRIQVWVE